MENRILTEKQKLLIDHLPQEIFTNFYLTEGTALSAFYFEHRLSQDLVFFRQSSELVEPRRTSNL